MSALSLIQHQASYDLRTFRRDPRARVTTVAVPVVLMLLLLTIFHTGKVKVSGASVNLGTYYVPHLAVMAVVSAAFANLLLTVVTKRESGSFKRRHATPVPAWVLISGDVVTSVLGALTTTAVLILIGGLFFSASVSPAAIGVAAVDLIIGSAAFCCMAYAVSSVINSNDSVIPVQLLTTLPLYFISGIYIPDNNLPRWLLDIAGVLPVRPLGVALQAAFVPATDSGNRFALVPLLILVAWGAAGLLIAVRRFSWMPRQG